jgi:hypothetical protein
MVPPCLHYHGTNRGVRPKHFSNVLIGETSLFHLLIRIFGEQMAQACANAFYEKVIKVKADVAAFLV